MRISQLFGRTLREMIGMAGGVPGGKAIRSVLLGAVRTYELTLRLAATRLDQETAGFITGYRAYDDKTLRTTNENPEAYRDADSQRLHAVIERQVGHLVRLVDDLLDAYDAAIAHIAVARGQVYNIGGGPDQTMSVWAEFRPLLERLAKRITAEVKGTGQSVA